MDYKSSDKRLYQEVSSKNLKIDHACEIGVFLPETSNIIDFINDDSVKDIMLVEPNPRIVKKIKEYFKSTPKIQLFPFAIHEYNGKLTLFEAEASTFADGLPASPALVNDLYQKEEVKQIDIECKLFSEIDPGDIDLLSIDTEGCEWYAIKTMESRPKVMSVETHGKFYTNPFIREIREWMKKENYKVWYKTKSDTVFYKAELFEPSFNDKLRLFFMNLWILLRRAKKIFYIGRLFKSKAN